jgi:hypothetical protein
MYNQLAEDYSSMRTMRATTRANTRGDRYKKDEDGKITSFKFAHSDILFTFDYDKADQLSDMESSAGWSWTKVSTPDFQGWLVRNYFDRWFVSSEECSHIYVSEFGIKANGKNPDKMELPERP